MSVYEPSLDASAMRCPRCLQPWDPNWVDFGAESATCAPCQLTVGLLDAVVPRWELPEVSAQLDGIDANPPWAEGIAVSEQASRRGIQLRGEASFLRAQPMLTLDVEGITSRPGDVHLPLSEIARVVPVVHFRWDRYGSSKSLRVRSGVRALPDAEGAAAPEIAVPTWAAARHLAARVEQIRRALLDRGGYR
jgi:hypothetical protein